MFHVESRHLDGVVVLVPDLYPDDRGFFLEAYRKDHMLELGLPGDFVQDNHSRSVKGVIRSAVTLTEQRPHVPFPLQPVLTIRPDDSKMWRRLSPSAKPMTLG